MQIFLQKYFSEIFSKTPPLRPFEIKTTPLLRPGFISHKMISQNTVNALKFRTPKILKKKKQTNKKTKNKTKTMAYANSVYPDQTVNSVYPDQTVNSVYPDQTAP